MGSTSDAHVAVSSLRGARLTAAPDGFADAWQCRTNAKEAERRQTQISNLPCCGTAAHRWRCARLSASHRGSCQRELVVPKARPRPCFLGRGGAPICRRSPRGADRTPFLRVLPAPKPVPVQRAPRVPVFSAGTSDARSRPGAGCNAARGHRPPAPRADMPSAQALWRAGLAAHVTQPVTNVNTAVTSRLRVFPGAAQHAADAQRCAADPGSSQAPRTWHRRRLGRPRISGAPFRFAPRCTASGERHVVCFSGAAQRRICVSRAQRSAERSGAVRCRPGTVTGSALLARATLGKAPDQRCTTSCCTASGERHVVCFPGAAQHRSAYPGRGAARSGALPTRDRHRLRALGTRAARLRHLQQDHRVKAGGDAECGPPRPRVFITI